MNVKYIFIVLFFWLSPGLLTAQVSPPELSCIRNDSLFWNNSPVNCGPYLGTLVFQATTLAGPYVQIAEINDPAVSAYADPNPGGQLRYYYLQYRYDCPGEPVFSSDTINNLIPLPPASIWVSVEDSTVVINWTASNSPQTSGYRIFRREPQGLIPIDVVSGATTTTYLDASFSTQPISEAYAVAAIDPCGGQSLLTSEASNTEVVTGVLNRSGGNGCVANITLSTDAGSVSSIPLPVNSWRLFVSINGGAFTTFGSPSGASTFVYDQANDGENLCFYLEGSVQGQPGRPLRTPIECVDVMITQPVRPFRLLGGGYDAVGNFCLDLEWDDLAEVDLLRANLVDEGSQSMALDLDFTTLNGPVGRICTPVTNLPEAPFSLNLRAEDVCGNVVITNDLRAVFLNGQIAGTGTNQLNWTPLETELDGTVTYQLERIALDGSVEVIYTGTDAAFTDRIEATDANLALSCYRVTAEITYPDGLSFRYASELICLEQVPMIYLPNAFSPNAEQVLNREFCPGFARLPTGAYQLDIFDRWGGHVFSSTSPDECWRGDYRGREAEAGVYVYYLRIELGNQVLERKGDVTLFR